MKFSKLLLILVALFVTVGVADAQKTKSKKDNAQDAKSVQQKEMKTQWDSISYALGLANAKMFKDYGMEITPELFNQAISDVFANNPTKLTKEQEDAQMQALNGIMQAKEQEKKAKEQVEQAAQAEVNKKEGAKFLEENKKKPGIVATASGLQYEMLVEGTGKQPKETSKVTVHYTGKLLNGKVFDSSVERGEPIEFGLNQVIKGWTEGVQLMKEGGKIRLFIPSDLAYGNQQAGPDIAPGSTLIFEVELIKVAD